VKQTIEDCLTEAMDISGLEEVLRRIERGEIQCIARDLPEPSPLAAEILNARPYAFLDNAPLEERRTQAVYTRRASDRNSSDGLGLLDAAAIDKVKTEAWPEATNADELHDALMLVTLMTPGELYRSAGGEIERRMCLLGRSNRMTARFWSATLHRTPMAKELSKSAGAWAHSPAVAGLARLKRFTSPQNEFRCSKRFFPTH
jgi:ATP-dependent Lhr-like helicase